MAEDTGKRLLERGWHQGSYFGPLSHLIHFKIDEPLRIPKPALEEAQRAFVEATKTGQDRPAIGQVVRLGRAKDRWVLATHECDLVKPESIEPYATAIRCFPTDNDRVLRAAASNSSAYFLLSEDLGLVADAREQIQVEKPALLEFDPSDVLLSDERRGRFARWLARRADRPATPDHIVEAFVAPILDLLRRTREGQPDALEFLERILEIRFRAVGDPRIDVDLLFFVERADLPAVEMPLAQLVGNIVVALDSTNARLMSWEAVSFDDISVRDYLATDQLYLDHYTLHGDTRAGLGPPPRI